MIPIISLTGSLVLHRRAARRRLMVDIDRRD